MKGLMPRGLLQNAPPLRTLEQALADREASRAEFMKRATHRIKPFDGPTKVIVESNPSREDFAFMEWQRKEIKKIVAWAEDQIK